MAFVNVIVNGVSAGASYFSVDGSGRYSLGDGRKYKIPDGRHMIQVVEATGSGYVTKYSITENFDEDTAMNMVVYTDSVDYGSILNVEYNLVTLDSGTKAELNSKVQQQQSSIAAARKRQKRNKIIKNAVLTVLIFAVVIFNACNSINF